MTTTKQPGFLKFSAFQELRPTILETIKLADSLLDSNPKQKEIIQQLKTNSINCMLYLVDGYNKYHSDEKATLYSNARSSVAKIQCLLTLLSDISIIQLQQSNTLITTYETKMTLFGGLIRKMEDRLYA